jgi:TatD DNase family protein
MFLDVHGHQVSEEEDVVAIVTLNVPEYMGCCGLDLQHTCYSLGIHPWTIRPDRLAENLRFIEQNLVFDCVKAVGECGLDKCCDTPWEWQMRAFRAQAGISEKFGKSLIIHCVKAFDELIALHKEIQPQQAWIIHGFRGKPQQMEQLIRQGFYLSFGRRFNVETVREIPLERLFLETDEAEISVKQVYREILSSIHIAEQKLIDQIWENGKNCRLIG